VGPAEQRYRELVTARERAREAGPWAPCGRDYGERRDERAYDRAVPPVGAGWLEEWAALG
jgi:hypothetical protein